MKTNLYGNEVLNGGSKPSSRSLLAGEQSDTLGLLRLNDRKHPREGGFWASIFWEIPGLQSEAQRLIQEATGPLLQEGGLANLDNGCGRLGRPRKFLPRHDRILPQAASSGASLHRTRFPASFLWWGMACRAWAGHRQKFLPRRSRILGLEAFQETCLHRTHLSRLLFYGEGWLVGREQGSGEKRTRPQAASSEGLVARARVLVHKQGTRQKIPPRRNRILGKWLFRRLAVGNTSKTARI